MKLTIGNSIRKKSMLVGNEEFPKILASIGASNTSDSLDIEINKAQIAKKYGADIIIDHTLLPTYNEIHKRLLDSIDLPLSTIAVYDRAADVLYGDNKPYFTEEDVINGIEDKAKLGVDMLTIHASVLKEDLSYFKTGGRIISCTSRGGTMVLTNIKKTGKENFYFTYFDEILKIAKRYRVTLSLGSVFRPATIYDAIHNNQKYWEEIKRNAALVKRATDMGVGIMVEGIGHCPTNLIPSLVKKSKEILNAPYRVLTVATDCGLGYDHVTSAIATSSAVSAGADFVTAVSRSEHLGLPSVEDVKEAVITAKIATYAGYIARTGNVSLDKKMAEARNKVGCKGSIDCAIVPKMTEEELHKHKIESDKKCTMCGPFCALKSGDALK